MTGRKPPAKWMFSNTDKTAINCPQAAGHTRQPRGYQAWHEWAAKMAGTHTQHQCPGCGLWMIWRRRRRR
jgi:hypothetical protein